MRWAALPLMNTVPLPTLAVQVLGPQHAMWIPVSSTRIAGILFTLTSVEPMIAGPTAGCGQAGQPWASAGTLDLSPSRHWPGMGAPGGRRSGEAAGGHGADATEHGANGDVGRGERRDRAGAQDIGDHRTYLPEIVR